MEDKSQVVFEVGGFCVVKGSYFYGIGQITKITPQKVFYRDLERSRTKDEQAFKELILFVGEETAAQRLLEQLTSSRAQQREDESRARERRERRDADFIAAAMASRVHDGAKL